MIHTFDVRPWQNYVSPLLQGYLHLNGQCSDLEFERKALGVLNMPLVAGLYSWDRTEGDASPLWVLNESAIFKKGFLQKSLVRDSKRIEEEGSKIPILAF